jgi:DNA-binding NarL/FixJ family response regulator
MKSIVIVDNEVLLAEALAEIISGFGNYNVLYVAENGKAVVERLKSPENIPDIVLLDVGMPVMDGFQTAAWLKANFPGILILALSVSDDEKTIMGMIRAGARGYLLKDIKRKELKLALDCVAEKGYYYSEWITQSLFKTIGDGQADGSPLKLSDREMTFLQLAASEDELTYKEIADKMFCSPRTVESYRDSLFEKFGVRTRLGLVLSALKSHIIS